MPHHYRRSWIGLLFELSLDAALTLIFAVQAFLLGCLISYGYIPLPKEWANQLLRDQAVEGLYLQSERIGLSLNGDIELFDISIYRETTRQPILSADGAVIHTRLMEDGDFKPSAQSIVLTNGTLYLPAVYAPDGVRTPILEKIAFRLLPEKGLLKIDSFAAAHEDIHLRGTLELPIAPMPDEPGPATENPVDRFYKFVATALKSKDRASIFTAPTIAFKLHGHDADSIRISTKLSSRALQYETTTGQRFSLEADLLYHDNSLACLRPVLIELESLNSPKHSVSAQSLYARLAQDDWTQLLNGQWPDFEMAAEQLKIGDIELKSPDIFIHPQTYPSIRFNGSTSGFDGAIGFEGELDAISHNGWIKAKGSVDISSQLPADVRKEIPDLKFNSAPYYDLLVEFDDGFELNSAHFNVTTRDLEVAGVNFESLRAKGHYSNGLLDIEQLSFDRLDQWLDMQFIYDSIDNQYKILLQGAVIPDQYNVIMPSWWTGIFNEDFGFNPESYLEGDFIIYGETPHFSTDLYFGNVIGRNIRYVDIPVDNGTLIVRGRGAYTEIHQLEAFSQGGWLRGDIHFVGFRDGIPASACIRYDIDAQLPLDAAQKLLGEETAEVIADFKAEQMPQVTFVGAQFRDDLYPQFAGKSFVALEADSNGPVTYDGVPFDYLRFTLDTSGNDTFLRNMDFGYADGTGHGMIDIHTPPEAETSKLRLKLHLTDADYEQAINNLPALDDVEESLDNNGPGTGSKPGEREEARIGLNIHAEGPANDMYQLSGYGDFVIDDKELGAIQLLGPLSKALQSTALNFTSFTLEQMTGDFEIANEQLALSKVRLDGPKTKIEANGTMQLRDKALDMQVGVHLFGNVGKDSSPLKQITQALNPLTYLLKFHLTGTVEEQKLRSLFDPRNLLPF